jgi:hypothetical protein
MALRNFQRNRPFIEINANGLGTDTKDFQRKVILIENNLIVSLKEQKKKKYFIFL